MSNVARKRAMLSIESLQNRSIPAMISSRTESDDKKPLLDVIVMVHFIFGSNFIFL